jgi:PKD repeat protein
MIIINLMKKEKLLKKRWTILLFILFLVAIVFPATSGGSPDLTVTYPVQFSPSSVTQGGSITVTWTEKNQGTGDAGPYGVGVYLGVSEYGRDYLLGHFSRSGLGAGQSVSYTASFTIPQSVPEGSYYVTVFIDDINYVSESNENNNIGSSTPSKVNVASNTGTIRVIAQYVDGVAASNAKVYVDGQLKGYTDSSGTLMVSVPAGTHSVQVSQDVMGITNKYVSDAVSVSVPIGTCVDANVVLKCQGGCVQITGGSASPSSAKPGDTVTVTVKYVFFHCCSGCCVVKANAFGDWAKTTQLAVVHDGCEGTFHTEITKTFTFTLPATISPGTHYVRVGFNYDYSFKSSYDDLASTEHIDIPISVAAPSYVLTVNVKHADGSAVSGAYVCAGGTCAYADSYGTARLTLQQGTYTVKATKDYDISGTKISYYGDQSVTVTGSTSIDLNVMPQGGCFYLRSFQLSKSSLNPGETVSGSAEWVFAKCCPNCIVYAVVYDQAGKEVARLWQGGDSGYTHQVITKTFTYTAPSTPGTYCLTLNVAYDYSPPGPSQGIMGKTCFTVSQQTVLDGQITGVNPSSASVSPGQSVQFAFTVKNTGNVVSDYHVYFPDGSLFGYVSGTITLNPGQQGQITLTGTVPSGAQPGSYSVDVYFEMAQHGQPWQKTQKWGTVQVNVQGPQPGYIRATITNNDDDTLDVYLYIDGALRLSALSRPPGSTFTSDPISVQGNTQHTVTIKWRDPDTSQEYSKSVNVYVPQGQTVTATLTIDLHTAGSPRLEITHNFPSQVTSGNTFSVTVTVRNSGTADATNVSSGISWGGDAFSSLGCTGTWRKDRLAPGEVMQYTCSLKAGKPGTYTVEVSAVADSGVSAKSTVQVVVLEAKDTTPPSVKVLTPAGGEVLAPGTTFRIKWQATDNVGVAKISIYLYQASGLTSVIASNIQNTGYYDWTVPDNPGSYFIRIVAVDTSGNTGTADSPQFTIMQRQQKQPPTLALGNPQINGLTVTISGTATPGYTGATITRIHWDWGDGESEDTWLPATHTYTSPGTYTVTVTAYQSDGLTTAKTLTVTLQTTNKPPVADFFYTPSNPLTDEPVNFTDKSYDPDGSIVFWHWDFGDGTTSSERNPKHTYLFPGTYMVTLTVRDDKGAEKVISKTIYVNKKETIPKEAAQKLSELARGKSAFFKSLAEFIDNKTDPRKYLDQFASDLRNLGEFLGKPPENVEDYSKKILEDFLMQIVDPEGITDTADALGKISVVTAYAFTGLADVNFWFVIWTNEPLKSDLKELAIEMNQTAALYDEEANCWEGITTGKCDINYLKDILNREKDQLIRLKAAVNEKIESVLSTFRNPSPAVVLDDYKRVVEGDILKYELPPPSYPYESVEVSLEQTPKPSKNFWEFWIKDPSYDIEIYSHYYYFPLSGQCGTNERQLETGACLVDWSDRNRFGSMSATWSVNDLHPPGTFEYDGLQLIIRVKNLGGDNAFTFWTDEGIKEAQIRVKVVYKSSGKYIQLYSFGAQQIENLRSNLIITLDNYLETAKRLYEKL